MGQSFRVYISYGDKDGAYVCDSLLGASLYKQFLEDILWMLTDKEIKVQHWTGSKWEEVGV
jgi:hypothetical protein